MNWPRSGISLGRIAGIRIGADWSWLLVVALIVWTLATSVFPAMLGGLSHPAYYAMAVVGAGLFFGSLLLHELGHALQARRESIEIDGITLWIFGGVARFRGTFRSAGSEFRIAIAGPAVSLVLGAVFWLASWLLPLPDPVVAVAAWVGVVNLSLLVFNLIPALPLDGGRVLRSALWQWRGDFPWATRIAAALGRAFGVAFIAGGIVAFLVWQAYSGVWLAFVGWFLYGAAAAEARRVPPRRDEPAERLWPSGRLG